MCGIVASVSSRNRVSSEGLLSAARRLVHRGPDAQTVWIAPHGRVGLGHARLSIIDLATGDQPIANEDERSTSSSTASSTTSSASGAGSRQRGHRFRTRSDSEIALHLYEELGAQCLHQLRGEFAFVLWDEPNRTLFAARDRFGIKPLYYAHRRGACSGLRGEGALRRWACRRRWDRRIAVRMRLRLLRAAAPSSLFDGVYQVPPGPLSPGRRHARAHRALLGLRLPAGDAPGAARSDDETRRAVPRDPRRGGAPPAARRRAGGLLSQRRHSTRAPCSALAARHRSEPIRAFTLAFDMRRLRRGAPSPARWPSAVGAEFHPIPIRQSDLADNFADAVCATAETTCINAHGGRQVSAQPGRARLRATRSCSPAKGSDEILAGYPHFRRDMLLYNSQGQDPARRQRLLDELHSSNPVSRGPAAARRTGDCRWRACDACSASCPRGSRRGRDGRTAARACLRPDFVAAVRGSRTLARACSTASTSRGQLAGRTPVNQSLYLWAKSMLPNYILSHARRPHGDGALGRGAACRSSITGRRGSARRCRLRMKIRGMTEKYVLREAARPVLTDDRLSPPEASVPRAAG